MALKSVTPPATEPVSLTETKTHLRVDITDDDNYIIALITAARINIQHWARRSLMTQTWRYSLDAWPDNNTINLPRPPLQSVSSIIYHSNDSSTTRPATNYQVDTDSEPGRVAPTNGSGWPGGSLRSLNPIQITFTAGYGDAATDVPAIYRQAMLLLIGHWYENREATIAGTIVREIPLAVSSLIWMDRNF